MNSVSNSSSGTLFQLGEGETGKICEINLQCLFTKALPSQPFYFGIYVIFVMAMGRLKERSTLNSIMTVSTSLAM